MTVPSIDSKAVHALINRILAGVPERGRAQITKWRRPAREIRAQVHLDYVRPLRKLFDFKYIEELVNSARRVWPDINVAPHRPAPRSSLSKLATDQRIQLQARPYPGTEGLALRGFYVDRTKQIGLKRSVIYVNTAHHQAAIAAAFTHEMGHHLTAQVLGRHDDSVHFFFDAAYDHHLRDPLELSPDVIVSLLAYPQPIARRIFSRDWNRGLVAKVDGLDDSQFERVRGHIYQSTGFKFADKLPAQKGLAYLAGMVHFAKLRAALLAEYEI